MFQTTLALAVFLFPLAYSPGPGNLFFAANGARFGGRATVPATAGYHIATWVVTLAIGLGFAAALSQASAPFTAIRIAGSLYVLWIAWKMLRAGTLGSLKDAHPPTFLNGAALFLLNPKAYVIIALMFSQFIGPGDRSDTVAVLWITSAFTVNNLIAFSVWTVLGDRLARMFRTPHSAQILNNVFGCTLVLVALWMLFS